ncbi:hypothetical protein [Allonocardiopsis opalescens]|uniref:Uncharacterized protein n=1 Tax=Allonocardiopsis opalescens TaxID=1144618 RepID=A0A2T0PW68_9ACTN|nr:hypothetical protein [Allonocardiopsis opalescens]PRX95757.1 hypothetical protein CLV72_109370 [Allonocardiopsis opalescens]
MPKAARHPPPETAYWLLPNFHGLNIGLALIALDEHTDGAARIRHSLANLPEDQQGANWTIEYRRAAEQAEAA